MNWEIFTNCLAAGLVVCLWWQISELIADEIAYRILSRKRRREHQKAEEKLAALKANLERHEAEQATPEAATGKTRDVG